MRPTFSRDPLNGLLNPKGDLQDGRFGDEDARGREHTREADGQDFPADGPEQGWQIEPRGVYRGRQVGPVHCTVIAMRSAGAVNNPPDPASSCSRWPTASFQLSPHYRGS